MLRIRQDEYGKISDPRNTLEKKFWTQEIPSRKNFGPKKYP